MRPKFEGGSEGAERDLTGMTSARHRQSLDRYEHTNVKSDIRTTNGEEGYRRRLSLGVYVSDCSGRIRRERRAVLGSSGSRCLPPMDAQ